MRTRSLSIVGAFAAGLLTCLGACGVARAQDFSSPPGRVAQLSYAAGSVSLEPAGTTSWTDAALNRPLTIGDRLWTDQDSRAELDIGDAVIRLGSTTGFSFLNLDDQTAQMQVSAGTVIVHVRSLASGEQDEIDTPNLALTLEQPGIYRVEVSEAGDATIVKVEEGAALATGGGQSYPLAAQQSVTFTGTSLLAADYATLGAPDALDDWSMRRDQEEQQRAQVAQQYVPPDMVGGDDLGAYGTWQDTSDWGYAWFPAVGAGWAPYSLGAWVWVSPWGWTWVDQEPWGFAPFHYGRWGYWHRRWCWIPGPRHKRPMYAPALVGWVGGHPDERRDGRGHVGWFPLGPHDVYVPGYHASPEYIRNINVANSRLANTAAIAEVRAGRAAKLRFANSEVPGAVTAVPRNVFTSAQPVAPHRVPLARRGGMTFRATTAAPAIMPLRQSVLGRTGGRVVRPPPRAIIERPVVARLAPARAPVSFAREQAAIRANGGRPLPMAELSRLRPNVPAAPVRLAHPPGAARSGVEWRTAPGHPRADGGMSARERVLQQPSLPPASRTDRPSWAQRQTQIGTPMNRPRPERIAPPQRQPQLEWRTPPQRQTAPERQPAQPGFISAPRQNPEPRFTPPPRQTQEPRFTPTPRQTQEPRFTPPPRQTEAPRFTPPPRQTQEPRFTPPPRQTQEPRFAPPVREPPQEHFAPPSYHPPREMASPRAAPPRPQEARPMERRPPPSARVNRRAAVAPAYAMARWQSPPPMYRPQTSASRYAAPREGTPAAVAPGREPSSPPPMYRPVPVGNAGARPLRSRSIS